MSQLEPEKDIAAHEVSVFSNRLFVNADLVYDTYSTLGRESLLSFGLERLKLNRCVSVMFLAHQGGGGGPQGHRRGAGH